ncbi:MAG TPA: zinc dependent phospholipase C family protein [Coriobacteriia bacterium]|nr:zinc dependent phospholipase C family protein [Coriobacteriia bacterium]
MARLASRLITIVSLSVALVAGPLSSAAFGWSNGPAAGGVVGNGYGTHDWVIDQAVRLAGPDAAWLDASAARLHSDDPDKKPKSDQLNHIYNLTRTGCGGPQTVANLYYEAVVAYREGDTRRASELVGELSHYYADICQPYHTYRNDLSARVAAEHRRYELAVDRSHNGAGWVRSWITPAARHTSFDVRGRAVSAALAARKDYPALKSAMRRRGYSSSATSVTGKITRRRLSRAANDLADIIASIPTGSGLAAHSRIRSVKPSQSTPRQAANVAVHVKVVDASGVPVRGARVNYTWHLGSRVTETTSYSDAKGVATSWHSMRSAPKGKAAVVSVVTVTNSIESTASASVVPR